jgi:hypothetical protein
LRSNLVYAQQVLLRRRPTPDENEKLFEKCIFIFDANVLLNLYLYRSNASEDLLKILQRIAELGRLWLPFQAALEYQENRLGVIADQKKKFGQVKKFLQTFSQSKKRPQRVAVQKTVTRLSIPMCS